MKKTLQALASMLIVVLPIITISSCSTNQTKNHLLKIESKEKEYLNIEVKEVSQEIIDEATTQIEVASKLPKKEQSAKLIAALELVFTGINQETIRKFAIKKYQTVGIVKGNILLIANRGFAFGTKEKPIAIIITHAAPEETTNLELEPTGEEEGQEEFELEPIEETELTNEDKEELEGMKEQDKEEL